MSPNAQKVLEDGRQLTPEEREWVAHGLLIEEGEELDAEWAAEIERRVADEAGAAKACSWEDLEKRLRARLTQ
jgi:putative addiction module component (TIGR02574 family)